MPKIECAATACMFCENVSGKYGECTNDQVTLKFRAAIDFPGKGTVIYLECMQIELGND
jgi:hypothetical protein